MTNLQKINIIHLALSPYIQKEVENRVFLTDSLMYIIKDGSIKVLFRKLPVEIPFETNINEILITNREKAIMGKIS